MINVAMKKHNCLAFRHRIIDFDSKHKALWNFYGEAPSYLERGWNWNFRSYSCGEFLPVGTGSGC